MEAEMPWMLVGRCVHKKEDDGTAGKLIKCHQTVEEAKAHIRALYASTEYGKSVADELIYISGSCIKSINEEIGEVGQYSIIFGDKDNRDFHGNWFTKNTFMGHNPIADNVALINHRVPMFKKGQFDTETEKALKAITDMRMKNPVKNNIDDVGVFSKLVLELSDKYEKMVFELVKQGVLKWSSGTAPQTYKALPSGELEMFIPVERSLTPIPAEYKMLEHKVMPLKIYTDFLVTENSRDLDRNLKYFFASMNKPVAFYEAFIK
jgi:hypothetical protein